MWSPSAGEMCEQFRSLMQMRYPHRRYAVVADMQSRGPLLITAARVAAGARSAAYAGTSDLLPSNAERAAQRSRSLYQSPDVRRTSAYSRAAFGLLRNYWLQLMDQSKCDISAAARLAGIRRPEVYRHLQRYGIDLASLRSRARGDA